MKQEKNNKFLNADNRPMVCIILTLFIDVAKQQKKKLKEYKSKKKTKKYRESKLKERGKKFKCLYWYYFFRIEYFNIIILGYLLIIRMRWQHGLTVLGGGRAPVPLTVTALLRGPSNALVYWGASLCELCGGGSTVSNSY